MLYSHRRHGPPFTDALVELDRVLAPTWVLRRARLSGVVQDERLTRSVLGRAASGTRASLSIALSGSSTFFIGASQLQIARGECLLTSSRVDPLVRCTDGTFLEIDWDPRGSLGSMTTTDVERRTIGARTLDAVETLAAELREARPESRASLGVAAKTAIEQLGAEGMRLDAAAAARDLEDGASVDEQRLCDEIDRVLSHLEEGPHSVTIEEALGCSRRTLLRRTQSLCKRYLLPGLAADDWRTVRDSYRLLIGTIFATHPEMTTRTLATMLGYASSDALCHAFANAGLPSPAALRDTWGRDAPGR
jgi:hypothetical protein